MTRTAFALETNPRVKEPELIARVLAGDRIAARELYDAHAPRVFRLVYRLTASGGGGQGAGSDGDADLARELTQETFIRVFGQLARFRGESALSTWIHRITITVVSNAMRKVRRFREREMDIEHAHGIGVESNEADPDLKERLTAAIDALPEIYRTTLVMHDIEGYTHSEIGEVLGVAEGTCKSRLSAARAQLREALRDFRNGEDR